MDFVNGKDDIPNILWKIKLYKIHVPNHQADHSCNLWAYGPIPQELVTWDHHRSRYAMGYMGNFNYASYIEQSNHLHPAWSKDHHGSPMVMVQ